MTAVIAKKLSVQFLYHSSPESELVNVTIIDILHASLTTRGFGEDVTLASLLNCGRF